MRERQLRKMPYCQCPYHRHSREPAQVVDHKIPHRGDPRLFWDTSNLQSMAKECHDRYKQSEERGGAGFKVGSDEQGYSLDPDDDWYGGERP